MPRMQRKALFDRKLTSSTFERRRVKILQGTYAGEVGVLTGYETTFYGRVGVVELIVSKTKLLLEIDHFKIV